MTADQTRYEAATRFVAWLEEQVVRDGRGDRIAVMENKPSERLWLGRLAPKSATWKQGLGTRAQRLDPCAAGFKFQPASEPAWAWPAEVRFRVWRRETEGSKRVWKKSPEIVVALTIEIDDARPQKHTFGADRIRDALLAAGYDGYVAYVEVNILPAVTGSQPVEVTIVNDTPEKRGTDPNLYEASLTLQVGALELMVLDALPDSFRYNREVPGYGINGGVAYEDGLLKTVDLIAADRRRPNYWDATIGEEPDLRFARLADDPVPPLAELVSALRRWGEREWSEERLVERAAKERWEPEMLDMARQEAGRFWDEVNRCERGLEMLGREDVEQAFRLMNESFVISGGTKYDRWRAFQIGFLLAALPGLVEADGPDRLEVDTLWFATGGGKTETYLAVIGFSCFFDRLRGKRTGVTAWGRFPLRMLSLQQTQRFADALAGAEIVRRRHEIDGDPFSLGFLVGGTPNRIRDDAGEGQVDAGDAEMPGRHRVLLYCPFCRNEDLKMRFDRALWRLDHYCGHEGCAWSDAGLPFHVVDEEIYRFLPSVVVGTLDKAASIALQAAMRGLYAAPIGLCSSPGHGFTYAPRKATPHGCLVPDCSGLPKELPQELPLFAPVIRVQDELHLLRDSLGAIDSHYETLLDHLYRVTKSPVAKIIASSATLSGYEDQVETLYAREGRAFPQPGPAEGHSFWTKDGDRLARRFVGLAPRGVTQEYATDRIAESVQRALLSIVADPAVVCAQADIAEEHAQFLIDYYGVHVVYGTKLRDVEAAARSFESQPGVRPMNVDKLTGQTLLEEVRGVLDRLHRPEPEFEKRLHVICASSMMSHGVDVNRFNVITLLGLPLATAEFIQTTARIGREYPGLVFVLHRMGIERDASVFRTFDVFVRHGDRFIDPVAITRRSRRVLDHTFAGLFDARVMGIHEPRRIRAGGKPLSTVSELRKYAQEKPMTEEDEFAALCDALGLRPTDDDPLVAAVRSLTRQTFSELLDHASKARFIPELTPKKPMRSLREVEPQIPIRLAFEDGGRRR